MSHPAGRAPTDSLDREDILGCLVSRDFRMWVRDSGWVRGRFAEADARGLWIRAMRGRGGDDVFVAWDRVAAIQAGFERPRTRRAGFRLGAAIGYVAGVAAILAFTNPPADGKYYPFVVVVGGIPCGLVGGMIGAAHPGTVRGFERWWP